MDIYIKPVEKVQIVSRKLVYLKDIAEVYVSGRNEDAIRNLIVLEIPKDKKETYVISVIDVIKGVANCFPNAKVTNLGETDIVVDYEPIKKQDNKLFLYLKVIFVAIVLAAGASTTIMCFHTDAQVPKIFENYYYIFFGENNDLPMIMTIPYSLGLGFGIIVFFNHFSKFYLTKDPTPIEVEMTTYEKDTLTNIVDTLNKQAQQKSGDEK